MAPCMICGAAGGCLCGSLLRMRLAGDAEAAERSQAAAFYREHGQKLEPVAYTLAAMREDAGSRPSASSRRETDRRIRPA